jgi:hypothetical protein
MTVFVCLGCRTRVVASSVPRQCKKCRSGSAWFRPEEPVPERKPQTVNGIVNAHPTARI